MTTTSEKDESKPVNPVGHLWKSCNAGEVSYLTVLILGGIFFYLGSLWHSAPTGKYAIADKGLVIFEAIQDRPTESEEQLATEITKPILAVLEKYRSKGYVVIDASRDEKGNMSISALPGSAINITDEMRKAVKASQ